MRSIKVSRCLASELAGTILGLGVGRPVKECHLWAISARKFLKNQNASLSWTIPKFIHAIMIQSTEQLKAPRLVGILRLKRSAA